MFYRNYDNKYDKNYENKYDNNYNKKKDVGLVLENIT